MPDIKRTVKHRIAVADDLEVHVTLVTQSGEKFAEFRNYVPSLGEYGRGISFPLAVLDEIHAGVHSLAPFVVKARARARRE